MIYQSLSPASITAIAAVCGSIVGAMGSSVGAWIVHRNENRRDLLAKQLFHREQLYSDFIAQSARALTDAMQHNFRDPHQLIPSYALLSRIRLSSSTVVVESAEQVINAILESYVQPNLTPEDFQAWASKRNDPLREFSNICRRDLETLWTNL
jgi:hypothetical protein